MSYNLHNNTVSLSTEQLSMRNSLNLTEFSFHIMPTLQQINNSTKKKRKRKISGKGQKKKKKEKTGGLYTNKPIFHFYEQYRFYVVPENQYAKYIFLDFIFAF